MEVSPCLGVQQTHKLFHQLFVHGLVAMLPACSDVNLQQTRQRDRGVSVGWPCCGVGALEKLEQDEGGRPFREKDLPRITWREGNAAVLQPMEKGAG